MIVYSDSGFCLKCSNPAISLSSCLKNTYFIGGEKTLSVRHGRDITKAMADGPHKHSKNAYRWLEQYCIGDYDAYGDITHAENDNQVCVENSILKVCKSNQNSAKDLVDWDKPVLWQVGNLGAKYHNWIDEPVDLPLRLFYSDFCEYFSKTKWYVLISQHKFSIFLNVKYPMFMY